jgi:PAS domain S-box-containing protein
MKDDDPQTVLGLWRIKILNVFLGVVAVISLPAIGTIIISAASEPEFKPMAIAFSVVELFLIALAVLRSLPINLRVGGLWLIGYIAAILNLARTGLSGAGPLYLLVIPILILILVGKRASFMTAIFSGLLAIGCAILVEQGLLVPNLTTLSQGMSLTTVIMFLTIVMTILILFYGFQERLIENERRTQATLLSTQTLLEEQNATLEQKVQERTRELQSSSLNLEERNAELAIINNMQAALASKLDQQAIFELIGERVCEVFNVQVVDLVTYDPDKNLISMPYSYERGDRSVISPREPFGFRLHVIQSGEPILINQDFAALAAQHNNPILTGDMPKSALFVPLLMDGRVKGVISIQDLDREHAFSDLDVGLLQTLANAMSVAIENAHLFDEIKRQERQAHEMQRRMSDIINFLPDATLVIDRDGKVIAWNHAVEEMTGIPAAYMLGKGNYEYALPFYGELRPILIDLVLLPQEEIEKKYAHIHRDGNVLSGETYTPALQDGGRYLYATASALHDAAGNAVGAIEIIRDITERMHAQEELRKAKADAEQANHAKSAFLANMSHELRTPLNAIIGFTRIVRRKGEGLLPEKQTENLDKVLASAENLLDLINTVLDIAKIEAGRMDVLPANFRLGPLIDLCANTAQPLLRPTVMLEKQVDESITTLYSDQDKIRQIILNLLSNAAKFTHEGKITLSAKQQSEYLHIAVSDTGIGISPEALPHIFKEFEQADITTTRKYGGTGLGLTISRNLARLLGGDLTVQSEFGQGSTFTLVIPVHYERALSQVEIPAPPASDPQPAPVSETTERLESDSTKKHILVIDDDPDAVYLLQENLDQGEFKVSGCRNGLDGLQLARKQQPQAILLDILMPGTDGWQVLHELKNDPATASIPVILHTIVDKKALGFQLGAAAYLLKPLDPVAVREALDRVIVQDGHKPKSVLVVDDDPNVADMLRQFLPESDFSLESALDGLAGLQAIEAQRPDILLLDLIMPNLDGFGVIEHLRTNPQMCDLPIIVISAKDLTAEESACLKETVMVVMKKQGFQGEKLIEEINHVLRRDQ